MEEKIRRCSKDGSKSALVGNRSSRNRRVTACSNISIKPVHVLVCTEAGPVARASADLDTREENFWIKKRPAILALDRWTCQTICHLKLRTSFIPCFFPGTRVQIPMDRNSQNGEIVAKKTLHLRWDYGWTDLQCKINKTLCRKTNRRRNEPPRTIRTTYTNKKEEIEPRRDGNDH